MKERQPGGSRTIASQSSPTCEREGAHEGRPYVCLGSNGFGKDRGCAPVTGSQDERLSV